MPPTSDAILLIALGVGFGVFVTGMAIWQRKSFYRRNVRLRPDGPDPNRPEDAPFYDGAFTYRVTALPVRDPVWLFRPDAGLNGPNVGDGLVADLVGWVVSVCALWLIRAAIGASDRRWKVVVDRKDKPNVVRFHAVSVEIFNSQTDAESRRDEIVRGWLPNWKHAMMPRLSRKAVKTIREAAPAYVPGPEVLRQPPLSGRARIKRILLAGTVAIVGGAFTLLWIVGGVEIAAEGVRGSGSLIEYVVTLAMCLLFALVGIVAALAGWRLRPGGQ